MAHGGINVGNSFANLNALRGSSEGTGLDGLGLNGSPSANVSQLLQKISGGLPTSIADASRQLQTPVSASSASAAITQATGAAESPESVIKALTSLGAIPPSAVNMVA